MNECHCNHRALPVAATVFTDDGTLWQVHEDCEHGINDATPIGSLKYELRVNETAVVQTAVEQEA